VYSADGEQLGTLGEVRGEYVKVNAPMRPDYWLKADFILGAEGGRVNVAFNRGDLEAYKVDEPASADDPMVEQKTDALLSEEQQVEQRMRMEAELAEQREHLPHMHPGGEKAPPDTFGTLGEPVESELERLERERGSVSRPPQLRDSGDAVSLEHRPRRGDGGNSLRWWLTGALLLGLGGALWARSRRGGDY
jgi:hypothetical protein